MADVPATAARFSDRVADYVRYRPGYPPALLDWVRDELGIDTDATVADIGAGTGISSRMFLEAGHRVTAVEPNARMREAAESWLGGYPGFTAVDGQAEATTLDGHSVDLVSAAQAFHWFDMQAVRSEWRRILRERGLALVYWNSRLLDSSPFMAGYEQVLLDYGIDYTAVAERYQDDATMQAWFGTGLHGMAQFPNVQRLDFDALRGRLLSSSYAPLSGHPRHAAMIEALQRLFQHHARDGHVDFEYRTRAFAGTLD